MDLIATTSDFFFFHGNCEAGQEVMRDRKQACSWEPSPSPSLPRVTRGEEVMSSKAGSAGTWPQALHSQVRNSKSISASTLPWPFHIGCCRDNKLMCGKVSTSCGDSTSCLSLRRDVWLSHQLLRVLSSFKRCRYSEFTNIFDFI